MHPAHQSSQTAKLMHLFVRSVKVLITLPAPAKWVLTTMAVVDSSGRVHGTEQLRVVDASIMPSIISGNLNATVIMVAEKLADKIRGNVPLPPSDAPVYRAVEWRTNQRESAPEQAVE